MFNRINNSIADAISADSQQLLMNLSEEDILFEPEQEFMNLGDDLLLNQFLTGHFPRFG